MGTFYSCTNLSFLDEETGILNKKNEIAIKRHTLTYVRRKQQQNLYKQNVQEVSPLSPAESKLTIT